MFGISQYKLLFMTELLVAEFLFFYRLEKRKNYLWRLLGGLVVCYAAAFFYPTGGGLTMNAFYTSLMFCLFFLLTFFLFRLLFAVSWQNAFFCCILSYTTQHLAYELFSFVFSVFSLPVSNILYGEAGLDFSKIGATEVWVILGYTDIYVLTYGIAYKIIKKRLPRDSDLHFENKKMFFLLVLILFVDIVLNAVVVWARSGYTSQKGYDVFVYAYDIVVYVYSILSCILVLYVQLNMTLVKTMEREIVNVTEALRQAKKQYEINKETINLINVKCHDLKYQVGKFENRGIDKDTVDEIKDLISIYDTNIKTGNEIVDVLLTEKGLACAAKGISLTCMADCKKLSYMREGEIYAMFGNMLDNAIEAVLSIDDEERRCISLNVREVKGYLSITMRNYCDKQLKFSEEGLPLTTKEDSEYHGFGMRSIKLIVEKYDGTFSVALEDGVFKLNVMLPSARGSVKR